MDSLHQFLETAKQEGIKTVVVNEELHKLVPDLFTGFDQVNHEDDFIPESAYVYLEEFLIMSNGFVELVNPAECLRKLRKDPNEEDPVLVVCGFSRFYSTRDDATQITPGDLEFSRHEKEKIALFVVVGNDFLEWDTNEDHFAQGLSSYYGGNVQRHYYLSGKPLEQYKEIFSQTSENVEWAVQIFKALEDLWEEEEDAIDFERNTNDFNSENNSLTEYLIDSAFGLRKVLPFDPLSPPDVSKTRDEETARALNFIVDLVHSTHYREEELAVSADSDDDEKPTTSAKRPKYEEKLQLASSSDDDEVQIIEFKTQAPAKRSKGEKSKRTGKKRRSSEVGSTRRRTEQPKKQHKVHTTEMIEYLIGNRCKQMMGANTDSVAESFLERENQSPDQRLPASVVDCSEASQFMSKSGDYLRYIRMQTADGAEFVICSGVFVRLVDGTVLRVMSLWFAKKEFYVHGVEFVSASKTVLGVKSSLELFFTNRCRDESVARVESVVQVEYIPESSLEDFRAKSSHQMKVELQQQNERDSYFVKQMYSTDTQPRFEYCELVRLAAESEPLKNRNIMDCVVCMNKPSTEPHFRYERVGGREKLSPVLELKGKQYRKGDTVVLMSDTVRLSKRAKRRFKLDMKQIEQLLKRFRSDDVMFMELDRWLNYYVDDGKKEDLEHLFVTPNLFQIGLIDGIELDENREPRVKLLMLCRPEDTKMTDEEVLKCSPHELYLTTKEAFVSDLSNILSHCYVNGEKDDAWLERGPTRFFCSKKLQSLDSTDFNPLTADDRSLLNRSSETAPEHARTEPLVTMDIFAGVGGLSLGLEQAGVAQVKWAVEFTSAHAHIYEINAKKRGHEVTVFAEDVNNVLEDIAYSRTRSDGKDYPVKGKLDLICGGPPCQGFSGLNSNRSGEAAGQKRSMVTSYLSTIDLLRPRFFLLENVGGIQNKVEGVDVLAACLQLMRGMEYQVTVCYLQAAQYGVPQDRKRVFIAGAAPGERLPEWPLPLTGCWQRQQKMELRMGGNKFQTPSLCPGDIEAGALYKPTTIWDAIGDLETAAVDKNGCVQEMPPAQSYYQRQMRDKGTNSVTDHIPKPQGAMQFKRLELVPTGIPRADWRFLPHKPEELRDGTMTTLLKYNGQAKVLGVMTANRAVCAHMGKEKNEKGGQDVCKKYQAINGRNTVIPWCLPHTSETKQQWNGLYGRVWPHEVFDTIVTTADLMNKQGRRVHWSQDRTLSIREMARGQGFPDSFDFQCTTTTRFAVANQQIGNAVPPPLAKAIGHEFAKAVATHDKTKKSY